LIEGRLVDHGRLLGLPGVSILDTLAVLPMLPTNLKMEESMNRDIKRWWDRYRGQGHDAAAALRAARIRVRWDRYEAEGLVKLDLVPDDDPDLSFLDQTPYQATRQGRAAAKYIRELAERDGVWCQVASFRTDPGDEWRVGDSVGGLIGYDDTLYSLYTPDLMDETLHRLEDALMDQALNGLKL
jgi:hypothetical protein